MRHFMERARRQINPGRIITILLAVIILGLALCSAVFTRKVLTVEDSGGGTHVMLTSGSQPKQYMDLAGLVAGQYDQLSLTAEDDISANVLIRRAFPVTVMADGLLHRADMVEGTVADLLAECGVVLEGEDYVEPAPDTPITEDLQAQVYRVTYGEEAAQAEVAPEQVAEYVARLQAADPNAWFEESNAGLYDIVYRHRYVNGEHVGTEIASLSAVQVILPAGNTAGRPTGGWSRVMNANCTAYSSSGGRGASGLGLYYGTVAVNPNVIPYGTRMWIESADGSYVYGWAIATDTGIAMMASNNAVDLYFETYGESVQFGRRWLNVYIFD